MLRVNTKSIARRCCPKIFLPTWERLERSPLGYRLAHGAFWSLSGSVASRGLMFVAMVVTARMLGKEGFGELGIIRSTVVMFGVFAGVGLGETANKHVAQLRETDPERVQRILGLAAFIAILTGALAAGALFVFAPWLATHTLNAPQLGGLLRIASIMLFLIALNGAQNGALSGFEAFKRLARVRLAVGLSLFPLLVGGVYYAGLLGAVWALVIHQAVTWALHHLALRHEAAQAGIPLRFKNCFHESDILWRFALPATLSGVMLLPTRWGGQALLANQADGMIQLGILTAAMTFQQLVLAASTTLAAPLLPMLSNEGTQTNEKLARINILSSWFIGIAVALPLLLLPEVGEAVFGKKFAGPAFCMTLCIIVLDTCIALYYHGFSRVLAANTMVWWRFLSHVIWGICFLGSSVFLVSQGAVGLALAFLVAEVVQAIYLTVLCVSRNLVPRRVVISWNALLIWGGLLGTTFIGFVRPGWEYRIIGIVAVFLLIVPAARNLLFFQPPLKTGY